MTQSTSGRVEERLTRIEARFEAAIPHLATKADIAGLKWAVGFLGLVMLAGFGFMIQLITAMQ